MSRKSQIFIHSEFRPDLRAAMDRDAIANVPLADPASNCLTSFPRGYLLKGCGSDTKNDKSDKTKEVGKDDKAVKERADWTFGGTQSAIADAPLATVFA